MSQLSVRRKRSKVKLNYDYPVVIVKRSNKNMMAQLIEAQSRNTLFTATTYKMTGTKTEQSIELGKMLASKIKELKLEEKVLFDRNGTLYHGRVAAVADAIRASGVNM